MAYKRKRGGSMPVRRRVKKRFSRARRMRRVQRIANINRTPIRYSREISLAGISIGTGTSVCYQAYSFTLATFLPNYSELTALFDQYRLRSIVMKFRLIAPPEATNTIATQQFFPDIYCTVDHDDAGAPTSVDAVQQYGKCKTGILKPNSWFTYKCYPTVSATVYRTAVSNGYMPVSNKAWIDLAYTDVPYYGIKLAIDGSSAGTQTAAWNVEVRAYTVWDFKSSR